MDEGTEKKEGHRAVQWLNK